MTTLFAELTLLKVSGKLNGTTISSMAFGGGTPSLIPSDYLVQLMHQLAEIFPNFESIQKTMECTPESITEERLELFSEVGITRLSIGVQSLHSDVLTELGRESSPELIREKIALVKQLWDGHWSTDLIYGFKSHSEQEFLNDVRELADFGADHISFFPLVNSDSKNKQTLTVVDFSRMFSMHKKATSLLEKSGFHSYSIEDYSRSPEAELLYQKDVWSYPQKDLLIFGTGAFGITGGVQYRKMRNRANYIEMVAQGEFPVDRYLPINPKREPVVRALMGLHYNGIPANTRLKLYPLLRLFGIAKRSEDRIKLTAKGRFITSLLWAKIMIDRMV